MRGTGSLLLCQLYARAWTPSTYPARIVRSTENLRFLVDTNSYIEWQLFVFGSYQPAVTAALRGVLRKGDNAIDVGANVGSNSIAMADAVGPTGRVIALEPLPELQAKLRKNIQLNGLDNLVVLDAAATSFVGELELFLPKGDASNRAQSSALRFSHHEGSLTVRSTTLDEVAQLHRLESLRLIKIDVEGHEPNVLTGAEQLLARFTPHVLFEYSPRYLESDSPWEQMVSLFPSSKSYEFYEVRNRGGLRKLDKTGPGGECDILAVPN